MVPAGHSLWLCHGGREDGRGAGEAPDNSCGLGQEAACSPPVLAATVPAPRGGLVLGRSPPPCKAIGAPRNADPQETLLCLSLRGWEPGFQTLAPPCFFPAQILQRQKHEHSGMVVCKAGEFKPSQRLPGKCLSRWNGDCQHWAVSVEGRQPEQGSLRGLWEGRSGPPSLLWGRVEHVGGLESLSFLLLFI